MALLPLMHLHPKNIFFCYYIRFPTGVEPRRRFHHFLIQTSRSVAESVADVAAGAAAA